MKLTSKDYGRLLQFFALKNRGVILNKTQVNKILFYIYGVHLATTGECLFDNEKPQAWLYGPVFPIVYRNTDSEEIVRTLSNEQKIEFLKDRKTLYMIMDVVDNMASKSATQLVLWSHQKESPWHKTLYHYDGDGKVIQKPWSTPINDDIIKEYFSRTENRVYGTC